MSEWVTLPSSMALRANAPDPLGRLIGPRGSDSRPSNFQSFERLDLLRPQLGTSRALFQREEDPHVVPLWHPGLGSRGRSPRCGVGGLAGTSAGLPGYHVRAAHRRHCAHRQCRRGRSGGPQCGAARRRGHARGGRDLRTHLHAAEQERGAPDHHPHVGARCEPAAPGHTHHPGVRRGAPQSDQPERVPGDRDPGWRPSLPFDRARSHRWGRRHQQRGCRGPHPDRRVGTADDARPGAARHHPGPRVRPREAGRHASPVHRLERRIRGCHRLLYHRRAPPDV